MRGTNELVRREDLIGPGSDGGNLSSSNEAAPPTGSIWLAFTFAAVTLAILVLVLITLAKA